MKCCLWVLVIIALVTSIAVERAQAVGYERCNENGVSSRETGTTKRVSPSVWASLKQLPYVEKVPDAIDGAVSTLKDVLGQFGLDLNRRP
jgi:hypothetical protein